VGFVSVLSGKAAAAATSHERSLALRHSPTTDNISTGWIPDWILDGYPIEICSM